MQSLKCHNILRPLPIFQLSNTVLHPYQSVQHDCVCVSVWVCACLHACVHACMHAYVFCTVMLEPLYTCTLCVNFVKLQITFSVSMSIMCVMLRLFGTMSCGVGTLQVSSIIIVTTVGSLQAALTKMNPVQHSWLNTSPWVFQQPASCFAAQIAQWPPSGSWRTKWRPWAESPSTPTANHPAAKSPAMTRCCSLQSTTSQCVCVCVGGDIVLIAVCGTLIVLIILPCDKQKQVCDHKFITILLRCHSCSIFIKFG